MTPFDFTDKVAVVTGGSRGIGRAIVEELLARKCRVMITSRQKTLEWLSEPFDGEHHQVDFLDRNSLEEFTKELKHLKKIDILINNAAIHVPEIIDEVRDENWGRIFAVNVEAPMKLMRAVAPMMRSQRSGHIVNIASIAGFISKPGSTAYSASKSALIGMTRAAALSLAKDNIRVNALCPGYTNTDMMAELVSQDQQIQLTEGIALKRFADPREIARFAVFLASDWNTYITGQTIVVDGGVLAQ